MFLRALALALLTANPALADVPRVAVDIPPVHSLVAQVMGDLGTPQFVMNPGASSHDYAMRPSEAQTLSDADILIWIGADLSPWLSRARTSLAPDAISLELLETPDTARLPFREGLNFAPHDHGDHDEDHSNDDPDGHDGDHHDHDPHAWLDPQNARIWLGDIANALTAQDPDNAETYRANAANAALALDTLTADLTAQLAPLNAARFIVFHDAYHYFEARFGLSATAALSLGDAADPGPARIADLRALLAKSAVTCAFTEPQFNPRLLATVIEGTSVKTGTLDPLGASLSPGPDLYADLLNQLANSFVDCLSVQ